VTDALLSIDRDAHSSPSVRQLQRQSRHREYHDYHHNGKSFYTRDSAAKP
jgi:hypothetical protein